MLVRADGKHQALHAVLLAVAPPRLKRKSLWTYVMDGVNPVWEEKPLDVRVAMCVISGERQRKSGVRTEAIAS